ncbi:tetratricopeptide repeat protein [Trinickia violacea]|uniref:Tetratricopeptide repeat protein n=2 Tax=Trinickia violacea TaxID=2571746 RepID=A0A4P8IZV3_9BURK|nr:tetratricopeptide repeat protein [Trinickia violacea]
MTAAIVLALAGIYSAGGVREHIIETSPPSELTVAYLQAWLRTQPNNTEYLTALATQYLRLGRYDDAERIAARMLALDDETLRAKATLIRLKVAEQRAFASPERTPAREAGLIHVRKALAAAMTQQWDADTLRVLSAEALAVGAPDVAVTCYERLAQQDAPSRSHWQDTAGRISLADGQYRVAAERFFEAQRSAPTRDDTRREFLAGVQALEAGNLPDDALAAAQANVGNLSSDRTTLIVLLNLARAAGLPDLVDRYARALMPYAMHAPVVNGTGLRAVSYRPAWPDYMDGPSPDAASPRWGDVRTVRVSTRAATPNVANATNGDSKDDVATLVYQSFVESNDLANAEKVASEQATRHPQSADWQKRLAQVAEWHNEPAFSLKAWLAYANLSNDPAGWQNVLRLAPMLHDDETYVLALVHASNAAPSDVKLADQVIAAYERLGRPQDALAFLQTRAKDGKAAAIDERYATVAERAGQDAQALDTYRKLQKLDPGNTVYALRAASLLYQQSDYAGAFAALKIAEHAASDRDALYWRTYGQLARLLQDDASANAAYKHLLEGGVATPEDLAAMVYFYAPYPIDAGRTAELKYDRYQDVQSLRDAIYYYTESHQLDRVGALLARLTPKQLAAAQQRPAFLGIRAEYYRQIDRPQWALQDLARAIAMPDARSDVKAAYLWTLVDVGRESELRDIVKRWHDDALRTSELWSPMAAALMRLNRPVAALRYLRLQAASNRRDPLWLLTFADAEEMAGRPDLAWSVRRNVWRGLLALQAAPVPLDGAATQNGLQLPTATEPEVRAQLASRRVSLAQIFANGDVATRLLDDLTQPPSASAAVDPAATETLLGNVRGLPPVPTRADALKESRRVRASAARDVAVAWALSRESNALAKRWLARRYANRLLAPADAQLALALAEGDTAEMNRLLDQHTAELPLYNRIDASIQTDRQGAAQALAFNGLDGAPDDSELHQRLTDTTMFWAQSIDASVENYVEHPLDYLQQTLAGSLKLSEHYMIGAKGTQIFQRSTDSTQLINVPNVDRSAEFWARRLTRNADFQVSAGRRDALDSFYTANASAEIGRDSALSLKGTLGRNQMATEAQSLQIGGMKDNVTGGLVWQVTPRISVAANIEGDRFYSQARNFLGTGVLSQGEIDYKFRTTYPDYTLRLVGARGNYNATGQADALLSRLVPGAPTAASAYMPLTYAQYGAMFGFGNDLADRYTHAWRPYLDVGLVHDSVQGWGVDTNIGIAGTIFGGDHAAIYFEHESVSQRGTSVTLLGARYSWFY